MNIDFAPLTALALVVYTLMNLVKYVTNKNWNGAVTLLTGWGAGVGAVFLFGATTWATAIGVGDTTLDHLGAGDKVVLGLVVVSTAAFGYDLKRAFDRSDSAATPKLLPRANPVTTPEQAAAIHAHGQAETVSFPGTPPMPQDV